MDRRTLLAILLSALVLIFVPMLLERIGLVPRRAPPRQAEEPATGTPAPGGESPGRAAGSGAEVTPEGPSPDRPSAAASGEGAAPGEAPAEAAESATAPSPGFATALAAPARQITVQNELYEARFDTRGARLLGVTLKKFKSAEDGPVRLDGGPTLALELGDPESMRLLAGAVYEASESTDAEGRVRRLRFTAADTAGLRIVQTYTLDPDRYLLDLEVRIDGALARGFTDYRLILQSWPPVTERNVQEDLNNLQVVSLVGKDVKRHRFNDLKKGTRSTEGSVRWTAVRTKYFSVAVIPEEASANACRAFLPAAPAATRRGPERVASSLLLPIPPAGTVHHLRVYAGPNDYWGLAKAGHNLEEVVDLGWRWLLPFSRAILAVMVFVHRFVPNYGLVIILLSALVKLVFHPLTAASMRSIRAMQKVQPEIEKLRKRYEKDPQKLNQAVFQLYKQHKVNPFGGCLPMLIQMPVLFALYQVFLHAIELRQAHFALWINDLSAPDALFHVAGFPVRVLPLVMYGSAWLQQRLTPTDPRQVMTMHLMNLFLLVLFYNLPSGLVLYWTVTNLLTAAQQYLVTHRDRAPAAKAA